MNRERRHHFIALGLMVAGIAIGAAGWVVDGPPFWVVTGLGFVLVVTGVYFGSRAGAEAAKRRESDR